MRTRVRAILGHCTTGARARRRRLARRRCSSASGDPEAEPQQWVQARENGWGAAIWGLGHGWSSSERRREAQEARARTGENRADG